MSCRLIGRLPPPAAWASAYRNITALWYLQTSNNCVCVHSWEKKTIWEYKGDTAVWHFVFKLFIFVDFDWALPSQPSQSCSFYWIKISKRLNRRRVCLFESINKPWMCFYGDLQLWVLWQADRPDDRLQSSLSSQNPQQALKGLHSAAYRLRREQLQSCRHRNKTVFYFVGLQFLKYLVQLHLQL